MGPVIQPGPFKVTVLKLKAQRFHQMEGDAIGGAKAGDIAGVRRYFRLVQKNAHMNDSDRAAGLSRPMAPYSAREAAMPGLAWTVTRISLAPLP